MKRDAKKLSCVILAVFVCLIFGFVLTMYIFPMEDVSMNLSMQLEDGMTRDDYDQKGWSVYTADGESRQELEPNGFGGFRGIALGQTFYYSRVLSEDLDSPTLQLSPVDRKFSVWLDDQLLYTDSPEMDNRIGYLTLPMNGWDRQDPITVSLPIDYFGKTLTIAQSTPEYTEGGSVQAYPAAVMLYCGYAYESSLICESFTTAVLSAAAFALGIFLLFAFVNTRDWGLFCLALVAFLWMLARLINTTFYYKYYGTMNNTLFNIESLLSTGALLGFLTLRAGSGRRLLWVITGLYAMSLVCCVLLTLTSSRFAYSDTLGVFLTDRLPIWLGVIGFLAVLVLGTALWWRESRFYRMFTPVSLCAVAAWWLASILADGSRVWRNIYENLISGQVRYIYHRLLPPIMAAALFTAVIQAVKMLNEQRAEKRLLEQRRELTLASYETMRRQNEEVMMLRHDMARHFRTLHEISSEETVKNYLSDLLEQNSKIRPIVQSGNKTLDILLNGALSSAVDAGIKIELTKVSAPEKLPLSDADLCSLVMNLLDNAIKAASGCAQPFLKLDIHVKNDHLALTFENSLDPSAPLPQEKKETVPKHGLGLKIVRQITERYEGLLDMESGRDSYRVRVVLPLV